ncbi:11311_t:CDS:2, partial [Racocetra fulgida]
MASLRNHIKIHDDTIDKLLWKITEEKEKNRCILCQSNEDHLARKSLIELDVQLEDDEGEIGIDSQLEGDEDRIGIDSQLGDDKDGIGINSQLGGNEGRIKNQLGDNEGGILGDNKEDILEMEEINNQVT